MAGQSYTLHSGPLTFAAPTRHHTQLLQYYWLYSLCCTLHPRDCFVTTTPYFPIPLGQSFLISLVLSNSLRVASRGGVSPLLPPPQTGLGNSCQGPHDSTEPRWSGGPQPIIPTLLLHQTRLPAAVLCAGVCVGGGGRKGGGPSNIHLLLK